MQKLRRVVLDKMIAARLTSRQVDMMLYLSKYQDESGLIQGVYYRSVCEDTGMSIQSFYNVLKALEKMDLIQLEKNDSTDWDIMILDNDCREYNKIGQYLNTNQAMLYSHGFCSLSGGAKLLALFLLRRCGENQGGIRQKTEGFFDSLQSLMQVSKRVIKSHLKKLATFFSLGSQGEFYFVRPRKAGVEKSGKSEYQRYAEQIINMICRRNKVDKSSDQVTDTAGLMNQYRKSIQMDGKQPYDVLQKAVLTAVQVAGIGQKKPERYLQPKLVHKVLRGILGLDKPVQGTVTEN